MILTSLYYHRILSRVNKKTFEAPTIKTIPLQIQMMRDWQNSVFQGCLADFCIFVGLMELYVQNLIFTNPPNVRLWMVSNFEHEFL